MIKRGQIYFVKSSYKEQGSEQWGDRPAVIVSNDVANENSTAVEVCYTTTKPKTEMPTHFITNGCLRPSTVICEQITTVCTERIGELIGELSPEEMQQLDECLSISIGLEPKREVSLTSTPKSPERLDDLQSKLEAALKTADVYKGLYEHVLKQLVGGI